ncbi:MAG TPA: hypothetical protein VJM50_17055 [Pyrinomonadaceae bacterium]|nr:hypothetical protein [Pyrinomonadaceae bacterium]
MKTVFRAVDIHAFDVHTLLTPLISNSTVRPQFQFLTDATLYRNHYQNGKVVETKSFHVHPLSKRIQSANHFWKNYLTQFPGVSIDHWKLQAPFVCSLRQPLVKLIANSVNARGRVSCTAYLSALGWSTNLNLHMAGEFTLESLLDLVLAIRKRPAKAPPAHLEIDGKQAGLVDVFKTFREKLLTEVYDPQSPPQDVLTLSSSVIISLSRFDGPPIKFQKSITTKGMTDADQALMHSLLQGEVINAVSLPQKLREHGYTLVSFDRLADFMLIYFDFGALIFMQQSALRKGRRQRALSCFASNTRSAAVMIWSLLKFYNTSSSAAATNQAIGDARTNARDNLRAMGQRYLNALDTSATSIRYGKALFSTHETLKKLMSQKQGSP